MSSLFIEHIGFLGASMKRINYIKVIGVILMIVGIYLIKR